MKINKYLVLLSIALVIIVSSTLSNNEKVVKYNLPEENSIATVSITNKKEPTIHVQVPLVGKTFIGFREAIGFKESRGKYNCVNTLGYLGKYQFGRSTLKRFKIYNTRGFLKDAKLQEDAFIALCSVNKWILRKDIKRKVGKKINGILITESGILAASHLAGAGNVKKYLRSRGANNFTDAYGSNIEHYLKKFAGYDTSHIPADKRPQL
jgi:hypothetical protein